MLLVLYQPIRELQSERLIIVLIKYIHALPFSYEFFFDLIQGGGGVSSNITLI